tara:strand:- start:263 stop:523 length:261 start_codon:yes stop_codon:yes gene_type:complete
MDINQLTEGIKKKFFDSKIIEDVDIEDNSYLHKSHKNNNPDKFHIKLKIKSKTLKNMSRIDSNKFIFRLLDEEIKNYIHSLQILFI